MRRCRCLDRRQSGMGKASSKGRTAAGAFCRGPETMGHRCWQSSAGGPASPSYERRKNSLSFFIGPPSTPPKSFCRSSGCEQAFVVRKPVIRIEHVIAEVFECRAVETVRAGFCYDGNLRAGSIAQIPARRSKSERGTPAAHRAIPNCSCLRMHWLPGVGRCRPGRKLEQAFRDLRSPIHHEVIGVWPLAVHAELSLIVQNWRALALRQA